MKTIRAYRTAGARVAAGVGVLLLAGAALAGDLDAAIESVIQANRAAARSQAKVDKASDQASELLGQYRAVQEQIASVKAYNAQVERLLESQRAEIAGIRKQIDDVTAIGREATPLMLRMVDALEAFIELDVPFLMEERRKRVSGLKEMMDRADVTDSEKMRRILEAYGIEIEFGRTIEAYQAELTTDGQKRMVNFLRFGRISLTYLTLDESEAGVWDQQARAWKKLEPVHRASIKKGLRIARKQTAPDLIRIPVPAPEAVQ